MQPVPVFFEELSFEIESEDVRYFIINRNFGKIPTETPHWTIPQTVAE